MEEREKLQIYCQRTLERFHTNLLHKSWLAKLELITKIRAYNYQSKFGYYHSSTNHAILYVTIN
jgi:hypothetical protein